MNSKQRANQSQFGHVKANVVFSQLHFFCIYFSIFFFFLLSQLALFSTNYHAHIQVHTFSLIVLFHVAAAAVEIHGAR